MVKHPERKAHISARGVLSCLLFTGFVLSFPAQAQERSWERQTWAEPQPVSRVAWRTVSDGEEEARETGRLVLYFFTAEWCGPCHALKDDVFNSEAVARRLQKHFVPVEVLDRVREDGRNSSDVDRVQMRFLITGFPTMVVARPDRGYAVTEQGILSKEAMLRFLEEGPGKLEALERKARRERGSD